MTRRAIDRRRNERGQAAIETILLSFVLFTFVAAMFQVYLVNQTVFRSIAAAHAVVFERAFERNDCDEESSECEYSSDPDDGVAPRVIWSPSELPEVNIPIVGMFQRYGLNDTSLRLWTERPDPDDDCADRPCIRTKIGAGTYKGPLDGIWFLTEINPSYVSIDVGQLLNQVGSLGSFF